jgi:hypothetical protein
MAHDTPVMITQDKRRETILTLYQICKEEV